MKLFFPRPPFWRYALALCVLGAGRKLSAQEQTHWLSLKPPTVSLQMEVDDEMDSQSVGGSHVSSDLLYIAPTLGLGLDGSIYHPNLLQFDLKGQGGYIEQDLRTDYEGTRTSSHQTSFLQNYDFSAIFLQSKPYAVTFTADKVHTFQELDLFNQVTVDSQSFGGHLGYAGGPVPFGITLKHIDESETGMQYNSAFRQDNAEIDAQNSRANGNTTLSYNVGQYDQQTSVYSENQIFQYGTLVDTEKFWKEQSGQLNSSAYFNEQDETNSARNAIIQENLTLRHSPAWDSFYTYNFNEAYYQPSDSTSHYGTAGVHNQLYESLTSEFDMHGALQNGSAPGSSFSADTYGAGNSENYSKRLGDWGHLMIGNTVRYDLTHESNMGALTSVNDEQHTLTDGKPTFLNDPRVISVTQVTGPNGIPVYHAGIDYQVVSRGDLTQIERVPTSLALTNGSTVLVDYTVQSQPSGSIATFSDQAQIRLDMFHGMFDIYSGIGWVDNSSKEDFVLDNNTTTQSGADFNWRWFRTGALYETERGNLVTYDTFGVYQSGVFQPSQTSTISLNAREQWSHYPDQNLSVTDYSLDSRFTEKYGRHLDLSLEGGVWNESGGLLRQTLFTAGFRARYSIGKLFLSLAYQFNQQDVATGSNLRNFISFTARRDF